ncbi:YdiU family protein [Pseudonocardia sp. DSM 110487]|uniref:protein adenylyltransferase SelO n=1 Tax=Pseudonocardia sp. DSM 110487 TaxID=2865833 RepID=UPI001C696536|nr:YdiU family protein [Pseudonocardia sp. DSM 110487]QYN39205.1 YdiU family protein [Pseudonocardia sp. DSM 110487]
MTVSAGPLLEFDHSFARELPRLSVPWTAAPVPSPALLVLNTELAGELGLDAEALRTPAGVALFVGAGVPEEARPVAQVYAGHQFGAYQPRLGDGRALLLGELVDRDGRRRDLHLKGSGRTPFARGGDGKAAVGPMLREYVMGEAMHALGIPTSRALAVVATGDRVVRETLLPGAVLARVAASHLRVGTFQYAAGDPEIVRQLADYAIARHHPDVAEAANPYLEFYRQVVDAQASLVARWMLVGFVHGVMNTDNTTISGETIDYGPCAFMDAFDPGTVFSSIDHGGRYAYGNQPGIAQWNLARLGETLLPLIDEDLDAAVGAATEVVSSFVERYDAHWASGMAAKLGLETPDAALFRDLLVLLHDQRVDFTRFFRALSAQLRGGEARSLFVEPDAFDAWAARWEALLPPDRGAVAAAMDRVNPVYIPRNHIVEEALTAATEGDMAPFHRLLEVVASPFDERAGLDRYAEPAPAGSRAHVTYCGT